MTERVGDWIQTYTGRAFWPLDPRVEEIDIRDIAHSLAMQCRYAGHTRDFYSVAEHCCHAADALAGESAETQLWALLHDAAEAYLVDLPRPVKRSVVGYMQIEHKLERVIAQAFGLPSEIPLIVKRVDNALLADESRELMAPPPRDWKLVEPPLGVTIRCWPPAIAKRAFLNRFIRIPALTTAERNVDRLRQVAAL